MEIDSSEDLGSEKTEKTDEISLNEIEINSYFPSLDFFNSSSSS